MERCRPFTPHAKRLHKLRTEPWMYEYTIPLPAQVVRQERLAEREVSPVAWLLSLVKAFIDLPVGEDCGIAGGQNRATPQS